MVCHERRYCNVLHSRIHAFIIEKPKKLITWILLGLHQDSIEFSKGLQYIMYSVFHLQKSSYCKMLETLAMKKCQIASFLLFSY